MTRTLASLLAVAFVLSALGLSPLASDTATAGTQQDPADQKEEWQGRYRGLLQNAARFEMNANALRESYEHAVRRNYPRGAARTQFLIDAEKAEKELVQIKAELDSLRLQAHRDAIPPAWLYQVDDEPLPSTPAAAAAKDSDAEEREGRNPLYLKDDENQH